MGHEAGERRAALRTLLVGSITRCGLQQQMTAFGICD
jgi:hypothetical protein